jgi:hypothetical protein
MSRCAPTPPHASAVGISLLTRLRAAASRIVQLLPKRGNPNAAAWHFYHLCCQKDALNGGQVIAVARPDTAVAAVLPGRLWPIRCSSASRAPHLNGSISEYFQRGGGGPRTPAIDLA